MLQLNEEDRSGSRSLPLGRLSGRMQAPGNLWQEMWRAAKPIVAWRQKRLFDDTKEAEKILHSFSALRPAQIATLLLPAVMHASIHRLLEELRPTIQLPDAISKCRAAIIKIVQIARHSPLDLQQYEVKILLWFYCDSL